MSFSTIKRFQSEHSKLAVYGVTALLMVCPSRAGTIKVVNLPATGTDAATGISTTNTYLCCIDFGNNASPPGNINGVPRRVFIATAFRSPIVAAMKS